jgi:hypothetical protein
VLCLPTFNRSPELALGTLLNVRRCDIDINILLIFPVFGIFGNYNVSTATAHEVQLSKTMQTTIGNFIKDPTASPAHNWPAYVPGNTNATLAMIAYSGNVQPDNFIQLQTGDSIVSCWPGDNFTRFTLSAHAGWSLQLIVGRVFGRQTLKVVSGPIWASCLTFNTLLCIRHNFINCCARGITVN